MPKKKDIKKPETRVNITAKIDTSDDIGKELFAYHRGIVKSGSGRDWQGTLREMMLLYKSLEEKNIERIKAWFPSVYNLIAEDVRRNMVASELKELREQRLELMQQKQMLEELLTISRVSRIMNGEQLPPRETVGQLPSGD